MGRVIFPEDCVEIRRRYPEEGNQPLRLDFDVSGYTILKHAKGRCSCDVAGLLDDD